MAIFNSLGSNYSFRFALKALFSFGREGDRKWLKAILEKKYGGKAVLISKGRQAIRLALEISGLPKGSLVGINGFTCFAVYQAIKEAGYKPLYLDIDGRSLNFSLAALRVKTRADLRALIVQNTFGVPCDINKIKSFCTKNKILLIEDLAHSAGGSYPNGQEMGTVGDFTILSFGQDKIIDTVSGGALIIRNRLYKMRLNEGNLPTVMFVTQLRDRLYPPLTFLIRKTYLVGLGKGLHFILKKFSVLPRSVSAGQGQPRMFPDWQAKLAKVRFLGLRNELQHRARISNIYSRTLPKKVMSSEFIRSINVSTNLRFPIFIEKRVSLVSFLKNKGVFVSDIWYDAPVAPKRYLKFTDYNKGTCPSSERISEKILNLPTHTNVSEKEAEFISDKINLWLKLQ